MELGKRLTESSSETRIAIVGTDSSRPARLLEFLTGPDAPDHCRVTHDVLGSADAVLLCTRDGRDHATQALPLLAAGISVWVDKPLATREDDARAMVHAATNRGLVLACRSGLRAADAVWRAAQWLRDADGPATLRIEGPAAPDSPYGGLAHYGIHHVELACEVVRRAGRGRPRAVTMVVPDEDGVRAQVLGDDLTVDLFFRSPARCTGFAITAGSRRWPVDAPVRYLEDQVRDFIADVRHGRGTPDREALITPVRLLERILELV